MKKVIQTLRLNEFSLAQGGMIGVAILIVESFLKLGSFTLECLCFLLLWFFLDKMYNWLK
jgi:hypothetical protein